jgi:hypothetical protein
MHNVANSANTLQGYYRTAPSAPYSATIFVRQAWGLTNGAGMALAFGWRDSSGKLEVVRISWDSGSGSWQTYIDKWASSTSYNSTATSVNGGVITQALWMSLFSGLWLHWTDDNTNLQWYFGVNGLDWIPLLTSQGRTSYLSSPSEIYLGQIANVADGYLQLVSYTD